MYILHISGNAGDLYKRMIEAEAHNGCRVKFLYYKTNKGVQADSKIPEELLLRYQGNSIFRGPVMLLNRLNSVAKYVCNKLQDKPDLLYAHMLFSDGYIARRIKKRWNVPYIVAVRNTDMNLWFYWKLPWLRLSGYKTLKEAKKVVFLSEAYKIKFLQRLPQKLSDEVSKKAVVLPNGIDPFWHENAAKMPKVITGDCIRLITVGRIEENKNQITVKAAMDILRERGHSVSYTVIGDVIDYRMAKELGEDERINLVPFKAKEEQLAYYQKSDIFVMPSIHETFGLVYAEAMSQGLPVIYTKGQGFDGQFAEGIVGYAVNCMNAEEIADSVERIAANYANISENCIQSAKKFDWERITKLLFKIACFRL